MSSALNALAELCQVCANAATRCPLTCGSVLQASIGFNPAGKRRQNQRCITVSRCGSVVSNRISAPSGKLKYENFDPLRAQLKFL